MDHYIHYKNNDMIHKFTDLFHRNLYRIDMIRYLLIYGNYLDK